MLSDLLDLVLPRRCVGCSRPGTPLCPACVGGGCVRVAADVIAGGRYEAGLREAMLAYKERGRRDLARPLGGRLAAAVHLLHAPAAAVLVPVPSTARAARARGGDHVRRLAQATRMPIATALSLTRAVRDQSGLDAVARGANVAGAMRARAWRPTDGAAVVVDDIVTTGATLEEATRALRAAGWPVLGAAAVAATTRRRR